MLTREDQESDLFISIRSCLSSLSQSSQVSEVTTSMRLKEFTPCTSFSIHESGSDSRSLRICQFSTSITGYRMLSVLHQDHNRTGSYNAGQTTQAFSPGVLAEVRGTRAAGIDNATPLCRFAFLNFEGQIPPKCVDHHIEVGIVLRVPMQAIRQGMRIG